MKEGWKTKKIPLFYILMSAFIGVNIIIYGYMFYVYQVSYDIVEQRTISSMLTKNHVIINDIEDLVAQLHIQQLQLMQNSSMNKLVFKDVHTYSLYDVRMAQIDINRQLNMIGATNSIVSKVEAFFPENQLKISTRNGIVEMNEGDRKELFDKLSHTSQYHLLSYGYKQAYVLTSSTDILLQRHMESLPLMMIVSTISSDNILHSILERQYFEDNTSHFVLQWSDTGDEFVSTLPADRLALVLQELETLDHQEEFDYWTATVDGEAYVFTCAHSDALGLNLYELVREDVVFADLVSIRHLILLSIGILMLVILIFWRISYRWLIQPTKTLTQAFEGVYAHQFNAISQTTYAAEYAHIYDGFNRLIDHLNELAENNYKYKILAQEAQLKQLQFQINPHFLYNCYFILNSMIQQEDYINAERMSRLLGIYLKYIPHSQKPMVTLLEEVEHAKIYTEIQHFRFSRRLSIDFQSLPSEMEELPVPRILLQPLIENAFLHGMRNVESGGLIRIRFVREKNLVFLIVEDNGSEMSAEMINKIRHLIDGTLVQTESESVALINIHKRLKILYGERAGLLTEKSSLGGLKIMVCLPLPEGEIDNDP